MATSLAHDVCALLNAQGSPVYLCSLDVEGAFDSLPHSVLFDCVSEILPDISWRILYYWYTNMRVQVKWNNRLGVPLPVEKGTRQGGLTSPLLFNIYYQRLVERLSTVKCGINIDNKMYNVFAYADDLLLATLVARSRSLCDSYNIDMMKYVLSDDYKTITKQTVSPVISPGTNGLVDSVRALLSDYTADKRKILRVLLKSF